MQPHTT